MESGVSTGIQMVIVSHVKVKEEEHKVLGLPIKNSFTKYW